MLAPRREPRGNPGRESGFTLVELLIVIGIAAVLMSILVLGIRQASESFALRRAGGIALSEVRRAQAQALAERVDFTVEFVIANPGTLRTYRDTTLARTVQGPEEWPPSVSLVDEGDSPPPFPDADADTGWLPDCTSPGNPANKCVTFQFMGAPGSVGGQAKGAVLLRSRSGRWLWLTIATGTGKVSVER